MSTIDSLIWHPFLISEPTPASQEEVRIWETEFNYTLPADFSEFARNNQGCRPALEDLDAHNKTSLDCISGMFHFDRRPEHRFSLLGNVGYIEEFRPGALIFVDWSGDFMAFDYGDDPHHVNPPVIYWNHETKEVKKIAESFTELLQKCLDGGW